MKTDSHGRPSLSLKVYLFIKFSPLYLTQDIMDHAAAGNLKAKTVPRNKFSWFGNSGFVCALLAPQRSISAGNSAIMSAQLFSCSSQQAVIPCSTL